MRYLVIVLAMVVSFAASVAAQSAILPYTLKFSGTSTQGTINGAWVARSRAVYGTPTKLLLQAGTLDDTEATTETVSGSLPLDLRPPTLVP